MSPVTKPETVIARFYVKEGHEPEFEKLHTQSWQAYLRLGLIHETPHVVLRGKDPSGKTYFVEILTWKDPAVTEHPPAEVAAIWTQLNAACERIEFPQVEIVHAT